jgi:uncharacterized protein
VRRYRCAICQREVQYEGPLPAVFPFCSERCRMVDLGKWLREAYTIDRELTPEELPGHTPDAAQHEDQDG